MRKEQLYGMERAEALAFLEQAESLTFATTSSDGRPVLRTMHGAVLDGHVYFHGAPAGEKMLTLGREAVVCAQETIARIPSYFVDPERACPATTYYRSVQAHGTIEEVSDHDTKTRAMAALMRRFQPEGGHVPLEDAVHTKAIDGLLVFRATLHTIDGKKKLGQNRSPAELARVIDALWQRGDPRDAHAIDQVIDANATRLANVSSKVLDRMRPLRIRHGDERHIPEVVALLENAYWRRGSPIEVIANAQRGSTWVVATNDKGEVAGTARVVSDGARHAWIYDVMIAEQVRRSGLGTTLIAFLLDHPAVRRVERVHLRTRDAQGFYARFGFAEVVTWDGGTTMTLTRPAASIDACSTIPSVSSCGSSRASWSS